MRQVLFRIPLDWLPEGIRPDAPDGLPLYGFALMLALAFLICTWITGRRAQQEGIRKEVVQDLALWIFGGGLIGARLNFMFNEGIPLWQFFRIWDGGLVFYGSAVGGVLGYLAAYHWIVRKQNIPGWKLADIIAPAVMLGLCIGRLGCFLNGCCYGNIACPDCPAVQFPISSPPFLEMINRGQQSLGFVMDEANKENRTVGKVDPASPAAAAGIRPGDVIVKADKVSIAGYHALVDYLRVDWPRGKNTLTLTVLRGDQEIELPPFGPRTLGLHPTQLYSSLGAFVLFLLLSAYYPYKRRDGEVFILMMLTYPLHRFLIEALRNDTAMRIFGMTFSQTMSIIIFVAGLILLGIVLRRPAQYSPQPIAAATSSR